MVGVVEVEEKVVCGLCGDDVVFGGEGEGEFDVVVGVCECDWIFCE